MDNKVRLRHDNKQGHMGPAKLQEKEMNSLQRRRNKRETAEKQGRWALRPGLLAVTRTEQTSGPNRAFPGHSPTKSMDHAWAMHAWNLSNPIVKLL